MHKKYGERLVNSTNYRIASWKVSKKGQNCQGRLDWELPTVSALVHWHYPRYTQNVHDLSVWKLLTWPPKEPSPRCRYTQLDIYSFGISVQYLRWPSGLCHSGLTKKGSWKIFIFLFLPTWRMDPLLNIQYFFNSYSSVYTLSIWRGELGGSCTAWKSVASTLKLQATLLCIPIWNHIW